MHDLALMGVTLSTIKTPSSTTRRIIVTPLIFVSDKWESQMFSQPGPNVNTARGFSFNLNTYTVSTSGIWNDAYCTVLLGQPSVSSAVSFLVIYWKCMTWHWTFSKQSSATRNRSRYNCISYDVNNAIRPTENPFFTNITSVHVSAFSAFSSISIENAWSGAYFGRYRQKSRARYFLWT